jgi:hypothetical protein
MSSGDTMTLLKKLKILVIIALAVFLMPVLFPTFSPTPAKPARVSYNPFPGDIFHAPLSDMGLLRITLFQGNLSSLSSSASTPIPSSQRSGLQSINQRALRFINDTSYFPQSETTIAVDPANPAHVVGGFNDPKFLFCQVFPPDCTSSGSPASLSGFTVSIDGGLSVLKGSDLPDFNFTAPSFPPTVVPLISFGDPTIVPSGDGNFLYSSLAVSRDGGNGVMIAKSNPNLFNPNVSCVTSISAPTTNACWTEIFVYGRTSFFSPTIEDKPVIAVDQSKGPSSGSIYIGWDHFTTFSPRSSSFLARCAGDLSSCTMLSGGPQAILSGTDLFPAFTTPVVDGNGNVYLTWCDYGTYTSLGPVTCKVRSSPPGGANFGPPINILSFMGQGTTLPDAAVTLGFATEQFRTASIPWLTADTSSTPSAGNLYFTIQVCTSGRYLGAPLLGVDNPGNCGLSSILFTASFDRGATWSSPITLSKPAVNAQPYITVDPTTGNIFIVYYTTQFDPFNHRIDVVVSKSTNGGSSFHQLRITSVSNEPDSDPNMFFYGSSNGGSWTTPQYGDYFQATAVDGKLWVLFTANYVVEQGTFQTDPFLAVLTQ